MSTWTMTGLIALAAVIVIGSAIKLFTRSRIKNYEGIFNPESAQGGGGKRGNVRKGNKND